MDRKGMLTAADAAAVLLGSLGLEAMSDCSFGVDAVSCISEGDLDTIHFFLIW